MAHYLKSNTGCAYYRVPDATSANKLATRGNHTSVTATEIHNYQQRMLLGGAKLSWKPASYLAKGAEVLL